MFFSWGSAITTAIRFLSTRCELSSLSQTQGQGESSTEFELVILKLEDTCLEQAGRPRLKVCQWGQEYTGGQHFHLCSGIHSVTKDRGVFLNLWHSLLKKNHTKRKIIKNDFLLPISHFCCAFQCYC